jgi:uncharacterized protein YjbI with pentapeptide repeats
LDWEKPGVRVAIGVAATLTLAVAVTVVLQRTGGAKAVSDNAALIAAVIALGGVFTTQLVSIALDDRRARETRRQEDERTKETRELESQRAREAALQNYFENVGELLIEKPLRRASPGDNVSTVVRAQTLSVLEGLDHDRKRILLLFLYESGLIYKDKPVINIVAADLSEADLNSATLNEANLTGANLSEADLSNVSLDRANLNEADLSWAVLNEANLRRANLKGADLYEAV